MAKLWNPFRPVPIAVLVEEKIHQTRLDLLTAQEDAECTASRVSRLKTTLNRLVEEREQLHALEEAGLAYVAGQQAVPLKPE
jgi:hypothetical protein